MANPEIMELKKPTANDILPPLAAKTTSPRHGEARPSEPTVIEELSEAARFAAQSFKRTPTLTSNLINLASGMDKEDYERLHGEARNQPVTTAEKVGTAIGYGAKKISDPIGVVSALATGPLKAVGVVGAALEGAEEATSKLLQGEDLTSAESSAGIAIKAVIGSLGAIGGDLVGGAAGHGAIGELAGRIVLSGIAGLGIQGRVEAGMASLQARLGPVLEPASGAMSRSAMMHAQELARRKFSQNLRRAKEQGLDRFVVDGRQYFIGQTPASDTTQEPVVLH